MDHTDQFQILTRFLTSHPPGRQWKGQVKVDPGPAQWRIPREANHASVHRMTGPKTDTDHLKPPRAVYPFEKYKIKIQGNKK